MKPATLDRAGIAARIPHAGAMCLLDHLLAWDEAHIVCRTRSHRDPGNPLRSAGGLAAPCAIEYAAQAMALHGTLGAAPGTPPTPGFLASVRAVRLHVPWLDRVEGELQVRAERLAGDAGQALYAFSLHRADGTPLVDGRATVILEAPP